MENIKQLLKEKRKIDIEIQRFSEGKRKDSILDLQTRRMQLMSMLSTEITEMMVEGYFSPLELTYQEISEILQLVCKRIGEFAKC